MQQNKTVLNRNYQPGLLVPTAYFAMGFPLLLLIWFLYYVQGFRDFRYANSILDFSYYDALDTEIPVSPFSWDVSDEKVFVLVTELLSGVLFGIVAFSLFFDYFLLLAFLQWLLLLLVGLPTA